jgi:hypothetical protein
VRVSNGFPPAADSTTATITVGTPPAITTQPLAQTIASGQTATLSVAATGAATLTYQWYVGPSGTTTNPIAGASSSSYTTPALTTTTIYWVRVSNAYAPAADSSAVSVSIAGVQAQLTTPRPGSKLAGSTVSFQWTSGTGVTDYWLSVGTTFGGTEFVNQDAKTGLSTVVTGLPTTSPVFVRLWSAVAGGWVFDDYLYNQSTAHVRSVAPGDFDGDGKADITVFRPTTGTFLVRTSSLGASYVWGGAADIPVHGDYDGDGEADVTVFRPSTGTWYIRYSSGASLPPVVWGVAGDIPVPGDYDGDGVTDIAVFRPSTGLWYIRYSSGASFAPPGWGGAGDVPVPGDYDGDGITDIAVFRPSTGTWYIRYSSGASIAAPVWGGAGDVPVPGDYDGDGKTDVAIFRPSTSTWYIEYSSGASIAAPVWGSDGDIPVPGDYDGDGKTDIAVFSPSTSTWYILYSGTLIDAAIVWGGEGDIPLLAAPTATE